MFQRVRQIVDAFFDHRNLNHVFKSVVVAQHFQKSGICFGMTKFAFGKRTSQTVEFRLWQMCVEISPKRFHIYFDLSNCQQTAFHNFLFHGRKMRMKILNIGSKIYFGMYPKRFVDGIGEI